MRKQISPAVKCKDCGSIREHEKYDTFCDYCEKSLDHRSPHMYISIVSHGSSSHPDDRVFCNISCVMAWLKGDEYEKFMRVHKGELDNCFFSLGYFDSPKELSEFVRHVRGMPADLSDPTRL